MELITKTLLELVDSSSSLPVGQLMGGLILLTLVKHSLEFVLRCAVAALSLLLNERLTQRFVETFQALETTKETDAKSLDENSQ